MCYLTILGKRSSSSETSQIEAENKYHTRTLFEPSRTMNIFGNQHKELPSQIKFSNEYQSEKLQSIYSSSNCDEGIVLYNH